jgi:hypothetical protein
MGLALNVGTLQSWVDEDADEEGFASYEEFRDYLCGDFEAINVALEAAGFPTHQEPEGSVDGVPWCFLLGSYSNLPTLQRLAAYLRAGLPLPEPVSSYKDEEECTDNDPVLTALDDELVEPPDGPFAHLLYHPDLFGYYIPVDFSPVLTLISKEHGESWFGSSYRLLDECEQLAAAIGLPAGMTAAQAKAELDAVEWTASEGWKRYSVEAFVCAALREGARHSIQTGCALTFG